MRSEKWEVGSGKWEVGSGKWEVRNMSHSSLLTSHFSHFSHFSLPKGTRGNGKIF
ncbi:MAG: hypothetical protein GY749_43915 [Desulfobacteraceae bacterium]|nr:hypothetical protein [Desulfobacteraceae bacterium]